MIRGSGQSSSVPSHTSNDVRLRATGKIRMQVNLNSDLACGAQSAHGADSARYCFEPASTSVVIIFSSSSNHFAIPPALIPNSSNHSDLNHSVKF